MVDVYSSLERNLKKGMDLCGPPVSLSAALFMTASSFPDAQTSPQ